MGGNSESRETEDQTEVLNPEVAKAKVENSTEAKADFHNDEKIKSDGGKTSPEHPTTLTPLETILKALPQLEKCQGLIEKLEEKITPEEFPAFLSDFKIIQDYGKRGEQDGNKKAQLWTLLGDGKIFQNEWNSFGNKSYNILTKLQTGTNPEEAQQTFAKLLDDRKKFKDKEQTAKNNPEKNRDDRLGNFIKKYPTLQAKTEEKVRKNKEVFDLFLQDIESAQKELDFNTIKRTKTKDNDKKIEKQIITFFSKKPIKPTDFDILYASWKKFQMEERRKEVNEERVGDKREKFIINYLKCNTSCTREQVESELEMLWSAGTLTVEVFLDDILNNQSYPKLDEQAKGKAVSTLYSQWEEQKVKEVGEKNKEWLTYKKLLESAKGNGEKAKDTARKQKEAINIEGKSIQQIKAEFSVCDGVWQDKDREESGMLNTEQLIQSAFSEIETDSPQNLFYKIQSIGKIYFNGTEKERGDIGLNGKRGPQTQGILLALKEKASEGEGNEALKKVTASIDLLLSKNKDYGKEARKWADKLKKEYVAGEFDEAKTGVIGEQRKERKVNIEPVFSNSIDINKDGKNSIENFAQKNKSKNLTQALTEMTDEEVDLSISRDTYLKTLETFLKAQELSDELKKDSSLAQNILDNTGKGEAFEEIRKMWESSKTKKDLLVQQKHAITEHIEQQAGITAIQVRTHLLNSFGISIGKEKIKKNEQNEHYFEFEDTNSSGIRYTFNPSTGVVGAKASSTLNPGEKAIQFNSNQENFLFKIPTYTELVNKATDVSSYLPRQRPRTQEDFSADLTKSLQEKIDYQVGSIESTIIAENIEKNKYRNEIIKNTKKILNLGEIEQITQDKNLAYYQMFTPILNTLGTASEKELLELNTFFSRIAKYLEQHKNDSGDTPSQQELNDNPILHILSKPEIQKRLQEKGNTTSKSEFGLGLLIQSLEKAPDGKAGNLEDKVLNPDKISFLNTMKGKQALEGDQQFGKRYQETLREIESHHRKIAEDEEKTHNEKRCGEIQKEIQELPDQN